MTWHVYSWNLLYAFSLTTIFMDEKVVVWGGGGESMINNRFEFQA